MFQPIGNHSSVQKTLKEKTGKNASREGCCEFRVPDDICGELDGGVYHITVGGRREHPSNATCVRLATVPVGVNAFKNPNGCGCNGERYLRSFP